MLAAMRGSFDLIETLHQNIQNYKVVVSVGRAVNT